MVWWWGEGKNLFFEVPAQALLGEVSCWDGILPKRSKLSWNHQMHAMRDRERERTQIVDPCHEQKTTTGTITKEQEFKKIYQETERNECEGKKEKRTTIKKIDRELERQVCTNRLIPFLPYKNLALCQNQKESFVHQSFRSVSLKVVNFHGRTFLGD